MKEGVKRGGEKQGCSVFLPRGRGKMRISRVTEVRGEGRSSKKNEEKELFLIFTIENTIHSDLQQVQV